MPAHMSQKKLLILASIVMVFLAALFVLISRQQNVSPDELLTGEEGAGEQVEVDLANSVPVSEVPQMTFATYQTGTEALTVPPKVKSYTFNTSYSVPFVSIIG